MSPSTLIRRILMAAAALLPAAVTAQAAPATSPAPATAVRINGAALDDAGTRTLRQLETVIGPVAPGDYWYDARTGAAGAWGGPLVVFLPPGLPLGPALPAAASGGGQGQLTGVFVNGRELHPVDVQRLLPVVAVQRGRYWWDAQGNVGAENGAWLFNIWWLVQQRAQAEGKPFYHRTDLARGKSTYVGKGCAAVSGRLRASDHDTSYSYYVGC
ncbi:MAG: hypothetical protein ACKVQR_22950 [Aquabacterium sp.]